MSDLFQEDNWSHLVSFGGRYRNYVHVQTYRGASLSYNFSPGLWSDPDNSAVLRYLGDFPPSPGSDQLFHTYIDILPSQPAGVVINLSAGAVPEDSGILIYVIAYRENPLAFPGYRTLEQAILHPAPDGLIYPQAGLPIVISPHGVGHLGFAISPVSSVFSYTVIFHADDSGRLSGWTVNGVFVPVSWAGV